MVRLSFLDSAAVRARAAAALLLFIDEFCMFPAKPVHNLVTERLCQFADVSRFTIGNGASSFVRADIALFSEMYRGVVLWTSLRR
jgi:hypothetical protein